MNADLRQELARINQLVEQNLEADRRTRDDRMQGFEDALRWMLIVPVWTEALAQACGFPPTAAALEWLRTEGLCQSREVSSLDLDAPSTREYWMPPDIRQRELRRLLEKTPSLEQALHDDCRLLGVKLSAPELRALVPMPTLRWAELAACGFSPEVLAFELQERITQRVAQDFTAVSDEVEEQALADAMSWVRTAWHLEPLFGPVLGAAASAATRRIDFHQLRREDERRLEHYLQRQEQLEAFHELMTAPEDTTAWALHFVGKAGIGKTMLVRHLCTRSLFEARGYWARVDFDHLNPAYPTQAPWLLIEQLAEQLFLQGGAGRISRSLNWFDRTRLMVRELAGTSALSWKDIQRTPPWQEMLHAFANVVRELNGPVVLLFDTCEELAKLSAGDEPANVAATFQLLEELHQQVPGLRVVFFGRRPLASSGAGWRLADAPSWLPPRDFLRLHEMQSFSQEEAERYFEQDREGQRALSRELRAAVLLKTQEPPRPSAFVHARTELPLATRFNPFEVVLYADWIREDARVTPELLAQPGSDRYVELRIVERLNNPDLLKLLPMVALLGRFDEALLRDTWNGAPESFEAAFRELIRQEWVRKESPYHQVDEGLRPRLEAWCRATKPDSLRDASQRASGFLERFTVQHAIEKVEGFHYVLLAGLLQGEPERAVAWWHLIEKRTLDTGGFAALGSVCGALLADQGPLGRDAPARAQPFRAVVLATYAASLVHRRRPAEEEWAEVARLAPKDQEHLRLRALLGQLIAANAAEAPLDEARVKQLWSQTKPWHIEEWDEQLQAAWVGALAAILEQAERSGSFRSLAEKPLTQTAKWAASANVHPVLAGFALATVARAFTHQRKKPKFVTNWFLKALSRVRVGQTQQRWLDWRAPDDTGARVRLEMIRSLYPEVLPAAQLLKEWAATDGGDILGQWSRIDANVLDQDRLCTAFLQLEGAVRPPLDLARRLEEHGWHAKASRYGAPDCNAHRELSPSSLAHAQALGEAGFLSAALNELRTATSHEERASRSTVGASRARHLRLELSRRMRHLEDGQSMAELLNALPADASEATYGEYAATWAMLGMAQPDLTQSLDPTPRYLGTTPWLQHACWRSLPMLDEEHARRSLTWAKVRLVPGRKSLDEFLMLSLVLDVVEADEVAEQFGLDHSFLSRWFSSLLDWRKTYPTHPLLRLLFRARNLGFSVSARQLAPHIKKVGPRAAAQIALDEGELLALRLPLKGAHLLETARQLFLEAEDPVGAVLASLFRALALLRTPLANLEGVRETLISDLGRLPLTAHLGPMKLIGPTGPSEKLLPKPLFDLIVQNKDWSEILLRVGGALVAFEDLRDGGSRLDALLQDWGQFMSRSSEVQGLRQSLLRFWAVASDDELLESLPAPQSRTAMSLSSPGAHADLLFTARAPESNPAAAPPRGVEPILIELTTEPHERFGPFTLFQHQPYEDAALRAGALLRSLPTFARWAGGEVAFCVETAVAGLCWEAVVGTKLQGTHEGQLGLDLRRSNLRGFQPTTLWVRPPSHVGVELGDALSQRRLGQRWLEAAAQRTPRVLGGGDGEGPSADAATVDLLYLRASPLPTTGGPRLELTVSGHNENRAHERERLISADDLLAWMKKLRICILAGPQLLDTQRVESDRLRAATARAFACQLFASGQLTAVLVIPSLPEGLEFEVNALVAQAFTQQDWAGALSSVVREMRTHLFRALGQTDDAWEVAMDCCLYMPPQSQLHF
ncbi:ATP-binding protein [Corallococcus terminator]|uniref:ATP-binding protein n=1 Tax=Corallococcus terminator TaxID=2316733 RepID=A0A3A8IX45_9BACT|nr:ATP-binding protein [Corallococcus terminator]RKG87932.1 ATP-binding protein [Corallococcus terminator]